MNYIKHHKNVFAKMSKDESITSIDISIYNALFMYWNYSNFCDVLSISRSEIMTLSKVGNSNTYTKSLKRLHEGGYIIYSPSHSPLVGSKVTMCKYDKTNGKSSDITGGRAGANTYSASDGDTDDTLYKQYNNITKKQINNILEFYNSLPSDVLSEKMNELIPTEKTGKIEFSVFWDLYGKKKRQQG